MENVLKLYKYIDGVNDSPFPNDEEQVVISSFRYDVKRMSGAQSITCSVIYCCCLDGYNCDRYKYLKNDIVLSIT